ncbi:MAG TPA: serine hydrolase, partial [Thermoanaerobaculia bacterium]|nr:serine hydrolase [Thermoanaerobaculia bacterium]
ARAATGHDRLGRSRPINRPEEPNAAHSLLTTAPDLARFVAAVLASRGLPVELRDAMLTPVVAMRGDELASPRPEELWEKISWALGWGIQRTGDRALFWHWGDNGAFRSLLVGDPATGAGLVLLTNSENGLSVAAEIAGPIVGDIHWTTEWLGYDSYDSPETAAARDLRRTFVEGSPSAGLERYHALRKENPGVDDLEVALETAADLTDLGRIDAALQLLDAARPHHPGSAELLTRLGTTRVAAGAAAAAVASYEQALALADDDARLSDLLTWTRELAKVQADPLTIAPKRLEFLAGSYGPRRVTREGNELFYRREGGTRYRLIPVSPDTFALEGLAGFRIRFVDDENGRPVKIVGEYAGGETDETSRSDG